MNTKFLFELYKNRKTVDNKYSLSQLANYFIRLKIGEWNGKIYTKPIAEHFDFLEISENMLDSIIRDALSKIKLGNSIDVIKKIGYENIGLGCFVTPAMLGHPLLITQNVATLYFPTKIGKSLKINAELLAIPKISGTILFENDPIRTFSIPTLTSFKIELNVEQNLVKKSISKITIMVDKCWSPAYLDPKLPNFPLGVGIKSINTS